MTVKAAVVDPAGTVTLAGTNAGVPLVHSETAMSPAGAGPLSVTVPVAEAPPVTVVGFTETDERVIRVTIAVAD